jgi:molybdopterin synthase catalytic subunit
VKIVVRYFAVVRERLGLENEELAVEDGATVADALDALGKKHDAVQKLRPHLQVAVNQAMAPATHALADGDEIALIPPVAGGSDRIAAIVEKPSLERVTAAVSTPDTGSVVTFTGVVRGTSHGKAVDHLIYEAYVEMVDKVLQQLCHDIEAAMPVVRVAVEHATGKLGVGDTAVVVAVAAPHRAEAFLACARMIDELKKRAPIWKKEVGPDGESWVGLGP